MIRVCFVLRGQVFFYRCRYLPESLFVAAAARSAGATSVQVIV